MLYTNDVQNVRLLEKVKKEIIMETGVAFLFIVLIIIFSIIVTKYIYKYASAEARGERGEKEVRNVIGETVENEKYIINDLILQDEDKTAQIDHIVINPRAVFVIETKNYSGRIYGSENQQQWTQVLERGGKKNKLYNPLKQNATHIYYIKKLLGDLPIRSVVVFVQNNTEYITDKNVIPLRDLERTLKTGENVLTAEQMKTAYETLLASKSDVTLEEHVAKIQTEQQKIERGICPRCGGDLVLRHGQYGDFYGCSNYPKCKFKKEI